MLCFRKFVAKKFLDKKWGVSRFCVENFLCHSAEKFGRGNLLCCVSELFWYRKSLWIKRGGGLVSEFSVEKFWSHSAEKNSYGNPLVFH